jgi:hypothetical protein
MFFCCECYVLSGRGLCEELITRPEESYRLWCFVVCSLDTSRMRRPWPVFDRSAIEKKLRNTHHEVAHYEIFQAPVTSSFIGCCQSHFPQQPAFDLHFILFERPSFTPG